MNRDTMAASLLPLGRILSNDRVAPQRCPVYATIKVLTKILDDYSVYSKVWSEPFPPPCLVVNINA